MWYGGVLHCMKVSGRFTLWACLPPPPTRNSPWTNGHEGGYVVDPVGMLWRDKNRNVGLPKQGEWDGKFYWDVTPCRWLNGFRRFEKEVVPWSSRVESKSVALWMLHVIALGSFETSEPINQRHSKRTGAPRLESLASRIIYLTHTSSNW